MKPSQRFSRVFFIVVLTALLSACLTSLLTRAGTQVVLAILKPLVGLDPNANGLFQQPVIKNRMQGFLGEQYEPVMQLLITANQLQEEGPLYYVVSRYTPIPQIAEKAGFVWNSETNQMAVMLISGGSPTVLAEKIITQKANQAATAVIPQWPSELQTYLDQDALKKKAAEAAAAAITHTVVNTVANPSTPADTVKNNRSAPTPSAEDLLEAEIKAHEAEAASP